MGKSYPKGQSPPISRSKRRTIPILKRLTTSISRSRVLIAAMKKFGLQLSKSGITKSLRGPFTPAQCAAEHVVNFNARQRRNSADALGQRTDLTLCASAPLCNFPVFYPCPSVFHPWLRPRPHSFDSSESWFLLLSAPSSASPRLRVSHLSPHSRHFFPQMTNDH